MRSKNNITPKNSTQMLLAGSNNILDARLSEALILGDGNVIGDCKNVALIGSSGNTVYSGCENITMINSSGNTVSAGLTNVTLRDTFGITVTGSNKTYQGGAEILPSVPGNNISSIYEKTIQVSAAQIATLWSVGVELLDIPPAGYFTDVIDALAKVTSVTTGYAFANNITIATSGAARQINFGQILLNVFAPGHKIYSGVKEQSVIVGYQKQYIENAKTYLFAETSDPVIGDYTMTIYLTYKYTQL